MFKRVIWTGVGYGLGMGTSLYVQRRVRRAIVSHTPDQLRETAVSQSRRAVDTTRHLAHRARRYGINVAEATREGRAAMQREHDSLRREYGAA